MHMHFLAAANGAGSWITIAMLVVLFAVMYFVMNHHHRRAYRQGRQHQGRNTGAGSLA